jgi:hypothetical protein
MPKISVTIEAETQDEFLSLLNCLLPVEHQSVVKRQDNGASEPKDAVPTTESVPAPDEVDAIEIPAEPLEEKKARKPRGPNKPKMVPVTEEAPEEVEHVGTVAMAVNDIQESIKNGASTSPKEEKEEVLTRMDLGDTIAGYVRKYGINFAQTDVSKMLQDMFGADVRKKSDVPDTQPALRQAIATITQATIDNPYNRKVDVNG